MEEQKDWGANRWNVNQWGANPWQPKDNEYVKAGLEGKVDLDRFAAKAPEKENKFDVNDYNANGSSSDEQYGGTIDDGATLNIGEEVNKIRVLGYKQMGLVSDNLKNALMGVSQHSGEYQKTLMQFQGSGRYARIDLRYYARSIPPNSRDEIIGGKTYIFYLLNDNSTWQVMREGTTIDTSKVKEVRLEVHINQDLEQPCSNYADISA